MARRTIPSKTGCSGINQSCLRFNYQPRAKHAQFTKVFLILEKIGDGFFKFVGRLNMRNMPDAFEFDEFGIFDFGLKFRELTFLNL